MKRLGDIIKAFPSMTVTETCDKCGQGKKGLLDNGTEIFLRCDCEKEEKPSIIDNRRKRAFAGTNLENSTFDKDDGRDESASRIARNYADRFDTMGEDGLLFFGNCDSGKTFLGACIANALIDNGKRVYMRSLPRLLGEYQAAGLDKGEQFVQRLMSCDLLVLDDLGAERDSAYAQELVFRIIDERYGSGKPMVVTTNLTRNQLLEPSTQMQARIYNRILERCLPIELKDTKRRANKAHYDEIRKKLS